MKKYKLINTKTNEEHLCDKVTIDGFEYYVSDGEIKLNDPITDKYRVWFWRDDCSLLGRKKVIATNNPNIDIPKVVDEIQELAFKYTKTSQAHRRGYIDGYNKSQETHPFSEEDMIDLLNFVAQKMISLTNFRMNDKIWASDVRDKKLYSSKEIIQLWKEQQPITLYYK